MLNIEKGEWGIDGIQCNSINHEVKKHTLDYSTFFMSVSTNVHGIVDTKVIILLCLNT